MVDECKPLQPLPLFRLELEEVELDPGEFRPVFPSIRIGGIFRAASSVSKSFGTLISNSLGTDLMKKLRTHGAILCVLGFR